MVENLIVLTRDPDEAAAEFRGIGFGYFRRHPACAFLFFVKKKRSPNASGFGREGLLKGRLQIFLNTEVEGSAKGDQRGGQQTDKPGNHSATKRIDVHD